MLVKLLADTDVIQLKRVPMLSLSNEKPLRDLYPIIAKKAGLASMDGVCVWEVQGGKDGKAIRQLPPNRSLSSLGVKVGTFLLLRKCDAQGETTRSPVSSPVPSSPRSVDTSGEKVLDKTEGKNFQEHTNTTNAREERGSGTIQQGETTYVQDGSLFCLEGQSFDQKQYVWRQVLDPVSGRPYFFNLRTRTTVWKLPDIIKAKREKEAKEKEHIAQHSEHPESGQAENGSKKETESKVDSKQNLSQERQQHENWSTDSKEKSLADRIKPPQKLIISDPRKSRSFSAFDQNREIEKEQSFSSEDEDENSTTTTNSEDYRNFNFEASNVPQQRVQAIDIQIPSPRTPSTLMAGTTILGETITFFRDAGNVSVERTEQDDLIEDELFCRMGAGESKVMFSTKAVLDKGKKDRKPQIFALVRDWSGSYILTVIGEKRTRALNRNRKMTVEAAYPLISDPVFREIPSNKNQSKSYGKYELDLDCAKLRILTSHEVKKTWESKMREAYRRMYEGKLDKEIIIMRMASIDFARSFIAPLEEIDVVVVLDKILSGRWRENEHPYLSLRQALMRQSNRDQVLSRLYSTMEALDPTESSKMSTCFQVLDEAVKYPLKTAQPEFKNYWMELFNQIESKSSSMEIISQVDLFRILTEIAYTVAEEWKGRRGLPKVPFPQDFFHAPNTPLWHKRQRKRQKELEALAKCRIRPGVVLMSVQYRGPIEGREILGTDDKTFNLPYAHLPGMLPTDFSSFRQDNPEFQWIFTLPHDWEDLLPSITSSTKYAQGKSVRKQLFHGLSIAGQQLKAQLNGTSLGILLDSPIYLPNAQILAFICVRESSSSDSFSSSLSLTSPYRWFPGTLLEHKIYQKYNGLPLFEDLDQLDTYFSSCRFVKKAILHFEALQSTPGKKYKPGSKVLGYMRLVPYAGDYHVMVSQHNRSILPHVLLTSDKQEWSTVLQRIRGQSPHSKAEGLIAQKQKELASDTKLDEIASLKIEDIYPWEFVDLGNNVEMILLIQIANELSLPSAARGHFEMIPGYVFEGLHASVCLDGIYNAYMKWYLTAVVLQNAPTQVRQPIDAIIRKTSAAGSSTDFIPYVKAWDLFRWESRALVWALKRYKGEAPFNYADIISQIRQSIQGSFSSSTSWDSVAKTLQTWERQFTKTKSAEALQAERKRRAEIEDQERQQQIIERQQSVEVINLNCMIDDLASFNEILQGTSPRVSCEIVVHEIVEEALVEAVDGAELGEVEQVVSHLVDVVDTVSDLVDDTVLNMRKDQSALIAHESQLSIQQSILDLYGNVGSDTPKHLPQLPASYDHIISDLALDFESLVDSVSQLVQIITSTQESIELVDALTDLCTNIHKRSALINTTSRADSKPAQDISKRSSGKRTDSFSQVSDFHETSLRLASIAPTVDSKHSRTEETKLSPNISGKASHTSKDKVRIPKKASQFVNRLKKMNDMYRSKEPMHISRPVKQITTPRIDERNTDRNAADLMTPSPVTAMSDRHLSLGDDSLVNNFGVLPGFGSPKNSLKQEQSSLTMIMQQYIDDDDGDNDAREWNNEYEVTLISHGVEAHIANSDGAGPGCGSRVLRGLRGRMELASIPPVAVPIVAAFLACRNPCKFLLDLESTSIPANPITQASSQLEIPILYLYALYMEEMDVSRSLRRIESDEGNFLLAFSVEDWEEWESTVPIQQVTSMMNMLWYIRFSQTFALSETLEYNWRASWAEEYRFIVRQLRDSEH